MPEYRHKDLCPEYRRVLQRGYRDWWASKVHMLSMYDVLHSMLARVRVAFPVQCRPKLLKGEADKA